MSGNVAKNRLTDMRIDEISFVDRPANQHATVLISKADGTTEEDLMPDTNLTFTDADGQPVDESNLQHGGEYLGSDGEVYVYAEPGREAEIEDALAEMDDDDAEDREPELVGKALIAEISKAVDDDDRTAAIAKAFDEQQRQIEFFKRQAEEAQAWAEREHDDRLTEAFISKAEEFNLPVSAQVFGPILKKMATVLDEAELDVVEKVLTETGDMLYSEIGYVGTDGPASVYDEVSAVAKAAVSKAAEGGNSITDDDALVAAFEANPAAYAAYNAELQGR